MKILSHTHTQAHSFIRSRSTTQCFFIRRKRKRERGRDREPVLTFGFWYALKMLSLPPNRFYPIVSSFQANSVERKKDRINWLMRLSMVATVFVAALALRLDVSIIFVFGFVVLFFPRNHTRFFTALMNTHTSGATREGSVSECEEMQNSSEQSTIKYDRVEQQQQQ